MCVYVLGVRGASIGCVGRGGGTGGAVVAVVVLAVLLVALLYRTIIDQPTITNI